MELFANFIAFFLREMAKKCKKFTVILLLLLQPSDFRISL